MWVEACELLSEAERLQRQFFRPINAVRQPSWEPPIDLFETPEALYLNIALPGVEAQRIEVYLNGTSLVVSGFRPLPSLARAAHIHRLELPYGRFERRIALPIGRYELTTHQLQDGCLQINLHKL
jgi:HSP20 family molecular chaperone IbpA